MKIRRGMWIMIWVMASIASITSADVCQRVVLRARNHDTDDRHIQRVAYVHRVDQPRATVIICHGFMCSKDDVMFLRWLFPRCNTMIFDFRGHGEYTDGQCCTFGYDEAHEVIAAAGYARSDEHLNSVPIIAYGFSMGAAASIRAASLYPHLFDAAIWDCPFESTQKTLERCVEKLQLSIGKYRVSIPGRDFLRQHVHNTWIQGCLKMLLKTVTQIDTLSVTTCIKHMEPAQLIRDVRIPMLLISCWNDERAPYAAVKQVYDNAAGDKALWMTNGRRHFDSFFYDPDAYARKVDDFIQSHIHSINIKGNYESGNEGV